MADDRLPTPEQELVRRCVAGEPAAWALFAREYGSFLEAAIGRTLQGFGQQATFSAVEDLRQDLLLALVRDEAALLRRLDPARPLKAYLAGMAIKRSLLWIRSRRRESFWWKEASASRKLDESLASPPSGTVEARERKRLLEKGMERLPARERLALRFFYWERLDAETVGRLVGVPADSLWTLLSRARARLGEFLRKGAFSL